MRNGTVSYYETAAQIIPVIVLAIVVEYRIFGTGRARGDWWASGRALEPSERVGAGTSLFVVLFCFMFLSAEASALDVAFRGNPSAFDAVVVQLATQVGFFTVLFVPMQPYVEDLLDRIGPLRRGKLWLWRRTAMRRRRRTRRREENESPETRRS